MNKLKKATIGPRSLFNQSVDFVIPFHGQYERVMELLESIFLLTRSNFYTVYLVDDASPNKEFVRVLKENAQKNAIRLRRDNILVTLRNETQKGFGGACRVGFEAGESPYVCFVNSDCKVIDGGWLRNLGESLIRLKDQGVKVISPMTNNAVGGDASQEADRSTRSSEDVVLGSDSFLSLYCFLCERQLFSTIGGFLKDYPLGGYEDQEFAYRLQKHGFKQAVCRSSWIYHEGELTLRSILRSRPNDQNIIVQNREQCISDIKKLRG